MFPTHAELPFRHRLRRMLEISVQPLHVYGVLVRHFRSLKAEEKVAAFSAPEFDAYREWVRSMLPDLEGPFMDLPSRVALRRVLFETLPEEETALCLVLLEYFMTQLESYLQAASMDPDQRRYLGPICSRLDLTERPTEVIVNGLRVGRQSRLPAQKRAETHSR